MANSTLFTQLLLTLKEEDPNDCMSMACPKIYMPVCSTGGNTYANDCLARSCGAKIACESMCPCPEDPTDCKDTECPMLYAPVCSKNNITYDSACLAQACGGVVDCEGECPCSIQEDPNNCAPTECPEIYAPVCSTGNNTYSSGCTADACGAEVACEGECPCKRNKRVEDPEDCAPAPCPKTYAPVCSTGNNTYSNDCLAKSCGAKVACQGACPCLEDPANCQEKPCPMIYAPICSKGNNTYANACVAEACGGVVDCDGECPCMSMKQGTSAGGSSGSAAGSEGSSGGDASMPDDGIICPMVFAPVCGVDDVTYGNWCEANATGTAVACQGECPCPDLLQRLRKVGGVLIVPSDNFLLSDLAQLNLTLGEVDQKTLKARLAQLVILNPDVNVQKNGTYGMSEAGHNLLFLDAGTTGEPVVADLTADVELGIVSKTRICKTVTLVQVDWAQAIPMDFGDDFVPPPSDGDTVVSNEATTTLINNNV